MSCACVSCSACRGKGTIWLTIGGLLLCDSRCDDLDEMDTCEDCGGSGVSEICYECTELERSEMEKLSMARCVAHNRLSPCGWCEELARALEAA